MTNPTQTQSIGTDAIQSLRVKDLECAVCGKPATVLCDGRPHCPAHEFRFCRKEDLPLEMKATPFTREIRSRKNRCNVPNYLSIAAWRCNNSGFKYCDHHKAPHGTPESKHVFSKLKGVVSDG